MSITIFWWLLYLIGAFAQPEVPNAEERVCKLVLEAYERTEISKNKLVAMREKIRSSLPPGSMLIEFDEYFSGLIKKDRKRNQVSKELGQYIQQYISTDSLSQLIMDWQLKKMQDLRLIQYNLTKENFAIRTFLDTSKIVQYLSFFDIQDKNKVAELGAGSGWLSMLIGILYEDTELYVNELGDFQLGSVQRNIAAEFTKTRLARCYFAAGSSVSTGLEMSNLDVIIMVDVLHHFTDKASMLQSIKWSLANNGRLCLVEQVKTIGSGDYFCPQALEKWDLERLLHQNGFVKIREQLLKGARDRNIYLMEYRIKAL